jgi:peptidyl-prolyl cis-trans isomerase SurA
MNMTLLLRAFCRFAIFAVLPFACLNTPLHAQSVVVMVNGEPITTFDVEQRSRLIQISTHKTPARQQVIDELIDEKVKVKEAKKYGVNPTSADIDQAYANMGARMRMSPDQLTKSLASQGVRPDTIKARLKADLVWGSLVRGRFKDSLLVSDRDVNEALKNSGDDPSKIEGFEYQMRPVVLIVPRGAAASVMEARRKEADSLRERVQSCAEAIRIFKAMRNATIRDTVIKSSADLPPPLRDLLNKTPVGHLTPPEITRQGVEMVAVCDKKATSVDTPKKKEIREKMFAAKYEKKSKDYLEDIRKSAMIEYRQGGPGKKGE